jgi:mono/diheme cytochrome c family protein
MFYRASLLLAGAFAASLGVAAAAGMSPSIDNGHAIFDRGRDLHGVVIRAARPPLRPSCAACHGVNGAGGIHVGGAVSADLRHAAMVTHMKHPYTLALLERAISKGIDSDGQQLSPVMPRWQMSSTDLHDVAEYVLTQLK